MDLSYIVYARGSSSFRIRVFVNGARVVCFCRDGFWVGEGEGRLVGLYLSTVFLDVKLVLPFFASRVRRVNDTLLPLRLPMVLYKLVYNPMCNTTMNFVLPFVQSILFSVPHVCPSTICVTTRLFDCNLVVKLMCLVLGGGGALAICVDLVSTRVTNEVI